MNTTGTPKLSLIPHRATCSRQVPVPDTVAGIIGTVKTSKLIGKINTVYSYDDALEKDLLRTR